MYWWSRTSTYYPEAPNHSDNKIRFNAKADGEEHIWTIPAYSWNGVDVVIVGDELLVV